MEAFLKVEKQAKEFLIEESNKNYNALLELIKAVPSKKRSLSVETEERDKNFCDVLMHLYEWHAMLERWYVEGMSGDKPFMPAPGYKWRDLDKLNYKIWETYQDVTLNEALKKFKLSHERIMNLIKLHTNDEIMLEVKKIL